MKEINGYRNDIAYNHDYHAELAPQALKLLTLARGWAFPDSRPLRYLELGYGNGVSLNIHAAATPGEYWGTDVSPLHRASAEVLAQASGSGVRLLDQTFADLLSRRDLPIFDVIVAHGVWSWVSPENRALIVEILKRHLADGGIFFMSAVAQPWESEIVPLQRLLRAQHASDPRAALDLALALQAAGSPYFAPDSAAGQRLQGLKNVPDGYLVHEYLHAHWQPCLFAETAETLATAGLSFVGGRHLLDSYDDLTHPPSACAMLAAIDDPLLRESARDFLRPKRLRFDAFLKGRPRPAGAEAMSRQRFVLTAPLLEAFKRSESTPIARLRFDAPPYRAVLERLASDDGRPKPLAELGIADADPIRTLAPLLDDGAVRPAQSDEAIAAATPACTRLNDEVLRHSLTDDKLHFLASPVTGGGFQMSRNHRLFLNAYRQGARTPNEWVKAAIDAPLPPASGAVAQLLKEALYFQASLPVLHALRLIE